MVLPKLFNSDDGRLIDIEVRGDEIVKCVYRTSYNDILDLILVIIPQQSFVKTVWFNKKSDKHKTLQHWKYDRP